MFDKVQASFAVTVYIKKKWEREERICKNDEESSLHANIWKAAFTWIYADGFIIVQIKKIKNVVLKWLKLF